MFSVDIQIEQYETYSVWGTVGHSCRRTTGRPTIPLPTVPQWGTSEMGTFVDTEPLIPNMPMSYT